MTPSTDCPHGNATVSRPRALARLLGYSLIGLLVFFVPFEIGGRNTILLDHSASALLAHARPLVSPLPCCSCSTVRCSPGSAVAGAAT